MNMTQNSLHFITQGGVVTVAVALILLVMSVVSWYFIISKYWHVLRVKRAARLDIQAFWQGSNVHNGLHNMKASFAAQLARQTVQAAEHFQLHATKNDASCSLDEFIMRAMRRSLGEIRAELEPGMSWLASVGSVAPFVGLFGTVWGIYHALIAIGASGMATIDKVAGPVGESLIMTAFGLAVAIPAVLAYNALLKANRNTLAPLEVFAQDLHTLLTTGAALKPVNVKQTKAASVATLERHHQGAPA